MRKYKALILKKLFMKVLLLTLLIPLPYLSLAQSPKGNQTGVTFDKALPEDISNENFPDRIESFDFPKANLLDLVKAISKLTGMNFILDPNLNNKQISIIAASPITVAEAYKAFLSALAANDYSIIKSGAFWKIQTTEKAHKDNIEVYSGDYFPSTDQLVTRIIKLKHINATELQTSIKWLLSQDKKSSTHEASNSIIISDYGSVIERIMKIVYEMDVPGLQEEVYTVPVQHASSEDLAVILRELLSLNRSSRSRSSISRRSKSVVLSPQFKSKEAGVRLKISHIIPDTRTNSLIVRADKRGIKRVRSLVKKLDSQANLSRTGGVWVYNVLYGTAAEVYNTLMGIKPPNRKGDNNNRNRNRNRFFVSSSPNLGSSQQKSSESPLFKEVNIMADHNTNSLIISARSKYEYVRVLNVLKKIDVPRDQVFIQAIILEMIVGQGNVTDFNLAGALGSFKSVIEDSLGIQIQSSIFKTIGESAVAGFLSNSIGLANLQQAQFGPGLILGLPFIKLLESLNVDAFGNNESVFSSTPEFQELNSEEQRKAISSIARTNANNPFRQSLSTSFLPIIRLLRKSDNINVLSTPQITTLDNVPAFIEVGENAPVGLSNTSSVAGISQNIDRKDVTLKLEITPLINPESGTVQMDIKQKFDDFSERGSLAADLNRQAVSVLKRNIETQMVLHDRETAVLGGLLSDKKVINHNKVPLLGDLPFIGWLFKGSDVTTEKRNLLVFITPTIISGIKQREKSKEILDKKLEERIEFIEEYMRGNDPHENLLGNLIPRNKAIKKKHDQALETEFIKEPDDEKENKNRFDSENETYLKNNNQKEDMIELEVEDYEVNTDEIEKDTMFEETLSEEDLLEIPESVSGVESDSFLETDQNSKSNELIESKEFKNESDSEDFNIEESEEVFDEENDGSKDTFYIEDSIIPYE